jgi:hypothetical protein
MEIQIKQPYKGFPFIFEMYIFVSDLNLMVS